MNAHERLNALRARMGAAGVDAFLLPVTDEFLGEYVPAHAARLRWLTGFTGSAGSVVVQKDRAVFFTDGRYTLQAARELEDALYTRHDSGELTSERYLAQALNEGEALGFDPMLHSEKTVKSLRAALPGIRLVPMTPNPVDTLWQKRPEAARTPAFFHAEGEAGEPSAAKRRRAAEAIAAKKADVALLCVPESLNWLLNIRGHDLEYTPVLQARALLDAQGNATLYAPEDKLPAGLRARLEGVAVRGPEALMGDLAALGAKKKRLLIDEAETPYAYAQAAREAGCEPVSAADPCLLLKAKKSAHELEGIRRAHVLDGVALVKFLHWLDSATEAGEAVDEMRVDATLLEFRAQGEGFLCPSFATIAGYAENGAIVHYRATEETNRRIETGNLLLLDSGGQYRFGTTDITRTFAIGTPTPQQKTHFTLVLKGHIAIARARFPEGTTGGQLDAFARRALWEEGLDYEHGTGHGVGYALSVHEGPQRISKRGGDAKLEAGMILSNEPGYYRAGEYGIRIENLVAVVESGAGETRPFLAFDTLTCVPMDTKLVDAALLTDTEKDWLNQYHRWVEDMLAPHLDEATRGWLERACSPIL